jgi:hypothetical protein
MKGPFTVPGDETSQQSAVSVIPSSQTKASERQGPAEVEGEPREVRVRAALAASNRTEASLSSLMRVVQALSAGVSGARESNVELLRELEFLREMLGRANEHQLGLKNRLQVLEGALEQAQREAARERAFLSDQHDAFIAGLIEDHERVVAKLHDELEETRRRSLDRVSSTRVDASASAMNQAQLKEQLESAQRSIEKLVGERERTRETLHRLQSQRDEAQATVARLTRERDVARAETGQLRIQRGMDDAIREAAVTDRPPEGFVPAPSSRPPPPLLSALKPTVRPQLKGGDPLTGARSTAPMPLKPPAGSTRPAAPPLDFKSSVPPAASPSEPASGKPLKSKPDASTRPLVGYSMTEASEERVDTSRITSTTKPPGR